MTLTLDQVILDKMQDFELAMFMLKDAAEDPSPGFVARTLGNVLTVHPDQAPILIPAYARHLTASESNSFLERFPQLQPYEKTILALAG